MTYVYTEETFINNEGKAIVVRHYRGSHNAVKPTDAPFGSDWVDLSNGTVYVFDGTWHEVV